MFIAIPISIVFGIWSVIPIDSIAVTVLNFIYFFYFKIPEVVLNGILFG